MDAIKEYLRTVDKLEHGEINLGEYEELCKPLRDVRENKHGKWVESKDPMSIYITCSACGTMTAGRSNYCSNCGARMDGVE